MRKGIVGKFVAVADFKAYVNGLQYPRRRA